MTCRKTLCGTGLVGLLATVYVCVGGCGMFEFKGEKTESEIYAGASVWPFVPVDIKIHPFTTFQESTDEDMPMLLEARIQMLDRVGDDTKCVGTFRFDLFQAHSERTTATSDKGERIAMWDVSVQSLDDNIQYYDSITDTYVFQLGIDPTPSFKRPLTLVVHFTDPGGRHIVTESRINKSGPLVMRRSFD